MNSSNIKPFDPMSLLPPGSGHLQGLLSSGMTPRLQQHAFPLVQNSIGFQPTAVYPYNYNQTTTLPPNVKQAVNTIANSSLSMSFVPETLVPAKSTSVPDRSHIIPAQSRPLNIASAHHPPSFQQRDHRSNNSNSSI